MNRKKTEVTKAYKAWGQDLTGSNLHRNIWYLAIPMMLETGIINAARVLDTYWVAKLGSAALAVVTVCSSIHWVINSLSNGLGIGGMAVVARQVGARDRAAVEYTVWQVIFLSLAVAFLLCGLGLLVVRPMLVLLGLNAETLPLGVSYLRITFGGLFILVPIFVINAMLRGAGEARMALMVLFLGTVVTIVLVPALVFGFGPLPPLGVVGAAWAIVLGYGVELALQVLVLLRGRAQIGINLRNLRPDFALMGRIIRIALPSTVQMTIRSSSRLVIIGLVGLYGTFAMSGYGVANQLLMIALIPSFGLGNAAGALVGQNLGARKPEQAERNAWWASAYAAGYMAVTAALLLIFARPLVALFDPTPRVVVLGAECLRTVALSLVASAVGVVLARGFDGAGDTAPAMVINLFTLWTMEVLLAWVLSRRLEMGIAGVWWGRAISNLTNGLLFAFWFRLGRWKRKML